MTKIERERGGGGETQEGNKELKEKEKSGVEGKKVQGKKWKGQWKKRDY